MLSPTKPAAHPIPTSSALEHRGCGPAGRSELGPMRQENSKPLTDILSSWTLHSNPAWGSPGQPPAPSGTSYFHEEDLAAQRKLQGERQMGQAEPGHSLLPTEQANPPRRYFPEPLPQGVGELAFNTLP